MEEEENEKIKEEKKKDEGKEQITFNKILNLLYKISY